MAYVSVHLLAVMFGYKRRGSFQSMISWAEDVADKVTLMDDQPIPVRVNAALQDLLCNAGTRINLFKPRALPFETLTIELGWHGV